jgi:HSP90 family molecular chaperone
MKEPRKHSDYAAIRRENERKYGTDIGRIGKMLLADRYADRTHFIFELLQNAEDALAKRADDIQKTSALIKFKILKYSIEISHYGKPFDENDIKGICGIAESTKEAVQ